MTDKPDNTKALVTNDYFAPVTEPIKGVVSIGMIPVRDFSKNVKAAFRYPERFFLFLYGQGDNIWHFSNDSDLRKKDETGGEIGGMFTAVLGVVGGVFGAAFGGVSTFTALSSSGVFVAGAAAGAAGLGILTVTAVAAPFVATGIAATCFLTAGAILKPLPSFIVGTKKAIAYHKVQKQARKTKVALATQAAPQLEAPKRFGKITGMFKKKSAPVAAKEIPEPMGTIEHKPISAVKKPEGSFPL